MSVSSNIAVSEVVPTRLDALVFRTKSFLLQVRRLVANTADRSIKKTSKNLALRSEPVIGESKTRLWTETEAAERFLVAGKIQNLRVGVAALDGIELASGEVFSFWRHVGRTTRRRGFVPGRELREGCIIPNIGGGLCQLSNALYDAALKANLEIVERHAHTQVIAGSLAEQGRDATVFWNYVDLRFRSPNPFRIEAALSGEHLTVKFRGSRNTTRQLHKLTRSVAADTHLNSCASCGMDDCFRSVKPSTDVDFGRTSFLVDELVPEFNSYLQASKNSPDELFLPIDGRRFRRSNYAWNTGGFSEVKQSQYVTAVRSYRSRRLAAQGAERQRNLLAMSERLAQTYARRLRFDALHLVVQQELLPFLWKSGHLGGRTFDVMMTALPMAELQKRLDEAHKLHPESRTLADFRADADLIAAETEALEQARKVITMHTAVAATFPTKAQLLPWKTPEHSTLNRTEGDKPVVVFPASTLGRKGCYELREAVRGLDVKILTLGPTIESHNFWDGFDIEAGGDTWLDRADLVVLPAFVEHRPRRLLRAATAGVPVIATPACGVENVPGVLTVPVGDVVALREIIESSLAAVN